MASVVNQDISPTSVVVAVYPRNRGHSRSNANNLHTYHKNVYRRQVHHFLVLYSFGPFVLLVQSSLARLHQCRHLLWVCTKVVIGAVHGLV